MKQQQPRPLRPIEYGTDIWLSSLSKPPHYADIDMTLPESTEPNRGKSAYVAHSTERQYSWTFMARYHYDVTPKQRRRKL